MSTNTTTGTATEPRSFSWAQINPALAAAAAIIPSYYGFIVKSARQAGEDVPKMTLREVVKGGIKAAPNLGIIVGTQMMVQNVVEKKLNHGNETIRFDKMILSSAIVGLTSSPFLAVFNGQTMGLTPFQALRSMTGKQAMAITGRETSFVCSLRISEPMSDLLKKQAGDNLSVETASAFVSGAIGSVIGHPMDTALTLWQRGKTIESPYILMRGALPKAGGVGVFNIVYMFVNQSLTALENSKV